MKKIAVIGLGYVGLPTTVAISRSKLYEVVGFDIDNKKIELIKSKKSPIEDEDVQNYLNEESLKVSSDTKILKNTDVFIICVPTPVNNEYMPDYSIVENATKLVGDYLRKGNHVVLESTVNPGTSEEILIPILEEKTGLLAGKDFNFAHCPERINPGDSKWNLYNINRNIGSINSEYNTVIADFYSSFISDAEIHKVSSLKVAEATKIVENTFRDINIAFVNELAKSFDAMGIDLYETLEGASNKPFGFMPHWPGAGVGGHCIAVDPYYLIRRAAQSGFDHKFLKLAREINESMPEYVIEKLMLALNEVGKSIKGTRITLLGLAYKPNIGDIRESPAIILQKLLLDLGADLTNYDPFITKEISFEEALKDAEAVVIATAHGEFLEKLPSVLEKSKVKVLIDGRNCIDSETISEEIIYKGIGR